MNRLIQKYHLSGIRNTSPSKRNQNQEQESTVTRLPLCLTLNFKRLGQMIQVCLIGLHKIAFSFSTYISCSGLFGSL